jgi:hypothetical protein
MKIVLSDNRGTRFIGSVAASASRPILCIPVHGLFKVSLFLFKTVSQFSDIQDLWMLPTSLLQSGLSKHYKSLILQD